MVLSKPSTHLGLIRHTGTRTVCRDTQDSDFASGNLTDLLSVGGWQKSQKRCIIEHQSAVMRTRMKDKHGVCLTKRNTHSSAEGVLI